MNNVKKALFLDRDGVINVDKAYPYKPEDIVFNEDVFDLCRKAIEKKYLIVVVTNQAGVAKGYFTEDDVIRLHDWMRGEFRKKGVEIAGFYYCTYHKNGTVENYRMDSNCRKPRPGMFFQAAKDLDIFLSQSLMVGDKESDRIQIPGLKCIIIKSNYVPEGFDVENIKDVEGFLSK